MDSRFLECSSPAGFERFECLRSAPVVAVERPPDVLRRLVLSIRCEKEEISDGYLLFFACSSPAGLEHANVYVPLRSSQSNVPRMFDCTGFALFIRIANSGPEEVVRRIHNNSGIGESIYSDIIKSMSESM